MYKYVCVCVCVCVCACVCEAPSRWGVHDMPRLTHVVMVFGAEYTDRCIYASVN